MAIKSRNKVSVQFSMAGMSDIIFLLLIFFMLTSTLITQNALKLQLPESSNKVALNPKVTVSITKDFQYYINQKLVSYDQLESVLVQELKFRPEPTIALHADRNIPLDRVVKIMNIAKKNNYKLILATSPEE